MAFLAATPPGIAVLTTSSTLPRRFAPEQGTGPDTVNITIKLRLFALPPAQVSTAIIFGSSMHAERRKTIIITGASRGFGFALTKQFISNDWKVIPLVRKNEDAKVLKSFNKSNCFPIISDITSNGVQSSIRESIKSYGGIDVVINNAGVGGSGTSLNETSNSRHILKCLILQYI